MYIIFDLDDTILYKGECSNYTLEVLEECRKQGHIIVFNTARSKNYSLRYLELIKPDYSILCGGSNIIDKNLNTIYGNVITKEEINLIRDDILEYTGGFSVEAVDGMYCNTPNYTTQPNTFFDFKEDFFKDAYKIVLQCKDFKKIEELAHKYNLEYTHYLGGVWHRLTKKGITKWHGVLKLLELTNGAVKDTICFGDDLGDIEMLVNANIGVALKNSQPKVLEVVKTVTEYNVEEDGVAKFLVKEVLKNGTN